MPQPVKLSDSLIEAARKTATDADRSLAGQIEHWASLGRAIEGILTSADVHAIKRSNESTTKGPVDLVQREAIVTAIAAAFDPSAQSRLAERVADPNTTRYGTDPAFPGLIVRTEPNGKKTPGRFVGRTFVALTDGVEPVRTSSRA